VAEPVKPERITDMVDRALKAFDEAEAIIVDLARSHEGSFSRSVNELVIAAREWVRKYERPEKD